MAGELVLLLLNVIPGTEQSMEEVRGKRGKKKIKAEGLLALDGESERKIKRSSVQKGRACNRMLNEVEDVREEDYSK